MATVDSVRVMPASIPEWLSFAGLGTPSRRALVAAAVVSAAVYVAKPSLFFTEEGRLRPQHIPYVHPEKLPKDPEDDSTKVHFLMVPTIAALSAGVLL